MKPTVKTIKHKWETHKKLAITSAQIITILTLVAGVIGNHFSNTSNETAISVQNDLTSESLKEQRLLVQNLLINVAILQTQEKSDHEDICVLKEKK